MIKKKKNKINKMMMKMMHQNFLKTIGKQVNYH